jgi:molybdopterin-guanine dinucleotide biosynthesis protein B
MKTFSITGWSGCGKTTLISNLIKKFKSKDKTVVAVKNAKHKIYVEPETTDTFKFMEAGADEVFLVTQNQLLSLKPITEFTE